MKARSASRQTLMLWYLSWSLAAIALTAAHPFLYLRGTRYGYGRNIRPLECVAKGGGKGVCMFAWDCMKANGTHLGTCIDRFYFGSCCKMNNVLPIEVTEPSIIPDGGQSTLGHTSNELASDSDSSSETSSTDGVSAISSTPANVQSSTAEAPTLGLQDSASSTLSPDGHISTNEPDSSLVGHHSTDGLGQSTMMTTVDTPTSTEETTSIEDQSSTNEQTSILGETPTDNEGTSNEIYTTDEVIDIHEASWQGTTATSVTSSVNSNEIMVDESSMTLTTPSENADSAPSTTAVNVAVDPKPTQSEITSPGVTGELPLSGGEETSSEMPGDLTTTLFNLSDGPETQQTTLDIVSVTPVSAPATEVPDTGVTGETQTEKTSGSVATITIEEMKTTTSTYTPETVSISIDTTNIITDDSGISQTTVNPASEIVTTLQQEIFTEESTQPPKPSDLPPIGIFPGSIFPAAITQPPAITTWIPVSSTEVSSIGSNMSIIFPDFDNTIISTSKPIVDVFTVEPEPSTTGLPAIGGNEEEEDSEKPTVTEPTDDSDESDSSESEDAVDTTTAMTPVTTQSLEQELLNRLNTSNYKEICGTPVYPTKRIVGGSEASFGEWPWQVSLRQWRQVTFLHKCGAALLNENWAITAAHCVENVQPDELLLRLGEFDLETSDEPYPFAERKVQIVATHPQFEPRTFEYDLALLRFHEPVNFLPNIIPICIPQDDYSFINDTGYVTGWGRLYEEGPLPSVLQKVPVPVITNEECEAMYRVAGFVEHIPNIFICAGYEAGRRDSCEVEVPVISNEACRQMFLASGGLVNIPRIMMCAGYAEGRRDACEGDSGGPLVIQRADGTWYLAGVISWGIGCALPNQPGVYTRISEFREWIEKIIVF